MIRRAPSLLLLTAIGLLACAPGTVTMAAGPREYVTEDYSTVLERWTRSENLTSMSSLDNFLSVTATYESWDFRWAYTVRYAEDYRLTVDQQHSRLQAALAETKEYHQFYVALYAQQLEWADLTSSDPAWIVRLIDSQGNETAPLEIERIKKPGAVELTYFPYTTPWRTTHRIRFPVRTRGGRKTISDRATWLGLRFAGAQGNQQLVWQIAPFASE